MRIVIHHNPDCGTSRNVLKIIKAVGYAPEIIDYLSTGWTRAHLLTLLAAANLSPRDALRTSKTPAVELGLTREDVSDAEILEAMLEHPILVNRPFVATPKGVALCRPAGKVLGLLGHGPAAPFAKEDDDMLIDINGAYVNGA